MSGVGDVNRAGTTRRRATRAEMAEREAFLVDYAAAHAPVTVRGLYYTNRPIS